ncbi:hypothetical protein FACS189462_1270 [Spirochaetia bacterium]|nr:hypothetical protein FACS189462_1270 [Spirochaetia bacterium]
MEEIIIHNATKEWLKCIDVSDEMGMPAVGNHVGNIPPNGEITVRGGSGNPAKKISIWIGLSQKPSDE